MPDLKTRYQHEAALAKALAVLFGKQRQRLVDMLGWPPKIDNIPESEWARIEIETQQAMATELTLVYLLSLQGGPFQIGGNPLAIALDGMAWGNKRAEMLGRELTTTTRKGFYDAVALATDGDDLYKRTMPVLGPTRAETIGITETTETISAGEFEGRKRHYRQTQEQLQAVWSTARDDLVCPVCRPLDKKPESEWPESLRNGPPAHTRCRCWLSWEPVEEPETISAES